MNDMLTILSILSVCILLTACTQSVSSSAAHPLPSAVSDVPSAASSHWLSDKSTAASAGEEANEEAAIYHSISPEDAKQRMEENENLVIVDVRTQEEYNAGHIQGAILIPNETIGDMPPEKLPEPDAEILVYCRTGIRSRQASDKLVALGYTGIYDLGGIQSWPYETVSEPS